MAWNRLTINDLRLVLAEDEVEKLNERSLDDEKFQQVVQQQLDMVSDFFRGAFQSKGYPVDVRPHYTPPEYKTPILNYARWEIWTRFPMTEDYALSDPRKKQYEEARDLLKNPYIGVSRPDYSDDPELSGNTSLSGLWDGAIKMPWQKFPAMPFDEGFVQVWPIWRTLF